MLAQDICLISVTCSETDAHNVIDFAVRCLSRAFQCRIVSKKQFIKHTNREVASYIAKVNDSYDYIRDRKSFAEHTKSDVDLKKATTLYRSRYNKMTDLDKDIDPRYFMLESHFITPYDTETKESLEPRLYMRLTINKMLIVKEEATMFELAKQLSRNRKTEFIMIKRASGKAEDRRGKEMYFQYSHNNVKLSKAAQSGLFSWYREYTGIDIAKIMEQIDRNLDIYLAPQIIKDLKRMINASDSFIDKLRDAGDGSIDPDILSDNEEVKQEMTTLVQQNQTLLDSRNIDRDGKIYNTYMSFLSSMTPKEGETNVK